MFDVKFISVHGNVYPEFWKMNMHAKFGCDPTVVSKGGGVQTDRQTYTQRDAAALYSTQYEMRCISDKRSRSKIILGLHIFCEKWTLSENCSPGLPY